MTNTVFILIFLQICTAFNPHYHISHLRNSKLFLHSPTILPKGVSLENLVETTAPSLPSQEVFIKDGIPIREGAYGGTVGSPYLIKIIEQPAGSMELQNNFKTFAGLFLYSALFFMIINKFIPDVLKNRFGSFGNNMNNMNNKNKIMLQKQNISLSSFMGSPDIFEECTEIISFFKDFNKYKEAGVDIPKGFLLEGPPGTGKTLLAKIIASECGTNFICASGSDFVELYVGFGALKIRRLFETARKNKPCIIFIDEIDAVGKVRGMGMNNNDEREQTLNQLLYEMDGFNDNDNILVLASTNRHDILDKALLRPGRFDRIINVPAPDKESRRKILELFLNKKRFDKEMSIDSIVELTDGMTGAEIKNLVNEAGIEAVKRNTTMIGSIDVFKSLDKITIGITKTIDHRTYEMRRRVAIHELGHAFIVKYYSDTFNFTKVTIKATYSGIEGCTFFTDYDNDLYTKYKLKNRIVVLLGGRVAEDIYYSKDHSSIGASRDIEHANALARQMINTFGLGKTLALGENFSSGTIIEMIEIEILQLLHNCYEEAVSILLDNNEIVDKFINILLVNETIYNENFPELTKLTKLTKL